VVCGCDHKPYSDDCLAASYGINIDHAGECILPDGPCETQEDCGGDSYADVVFCKPEACGSVAGRCSPFPTACPQLSAPVCGCDGGSYTNTCFSDWASVQVAYPGPCRSGEALACSTNDDCGENYFCIDDPRADCGSTGDCPGVCLMGSYACGPYTSPNGDGVLGCLSGFCALGRVTCDTENQACGACVYGGPVSCDAANPCREEELCVPSFACSAPSCPSFCTRP
jgi:hypothetical protein